jgi:hypothetical protein
MFQARLAHIIRVSKDEDAFNYRAQILVAKPSTSRFSRGKAALRVLRCAIPAKQKGSFIHCQFVRVD